MLYNRSQLPVHGFSLVLPCVARGEAWVISPEFLLSNFKFQAVNVYHKQVKKCASWLAINVVLRLCYLENLELIFLMIEVKKSILTERSFAVFTRRYSPSPPMT